VRSSRPSSNDDGKRADILLFCSFDKNTDGYNELKLIVEGTIILEDKTTGIKIEGVPGDTLSSTSLSLFSHISFSSTYLFPLSTVPKGTPVTFSSPNFGKAFYVGQRKLRDW
jgi:hypothetical protein